MAAKDRISKGNKTENKLAKTSAPSTGSISYEDVKKSNRFYFNIVKKRYIWFVLSLVILIPGIISLFVQGLNYGIDFTGGTLLDIKFNQVVTQASINKSLEEVALSEDSVQLSQGDTQAIIRTSVLDEAKRDQLFTALEKNAGSFDRAKIQEDQVGPAIGAELRSGAVKALAVSAVLMLIYISFRFEFVYAVSGIIALLHDVFLVLGIFSIFRWQVDAPFVAAILTVFGYSINDTVVIYDRMRENEKRLRKRDSFADMVDKSLWQTMRRSICTVSTVLIALLCINIFGGESTQVFSRAMIIGVFCGAYSSIFIASQIVVEIRDRMKGKTENA
jgi:preprotein translocase SecF subunit